MIIDLGPDWLILKARLRKSSFRLVWVNCVKLRKISLLQHMIFLRIVIIEILKTGLYIFLKKILEP